MQWIECVCLIESSLVEGVLAELMFEGWSLNLAIEKMGADALKVHGKASPDFNLNYNFTVLHRLISTPGRAA